MEQVKFAMEKLAALITSQRFVAVVVGIVLLAFGDNILPGQEAELTNEVAQVLQYAATVIGAVALLLGYVVSATKRPPTLSREDYKQ